ncbi:DUF4112 domain-containing protein [Empedobacter falsenii]
MTTKRERKQKEVNNYTTSNHLTEEEILYVAKYEKINKSSELRREEIKSSYSFKLMKNISTVMDKFYLDPIIGLILPGIGDFITTFLALPSIQVSLFKVKSIPLTLAVIFNISKDVLIGFFPILGDIYDFFFKANLKNYTLIVGFVEGDEKIIKDVNRKALLTLFLILLLIGLNILAYLLVSKIISLLIEGGKNLLNIIL